MKLSQLKTLLSQNAGKTFQLRLPDDSSVPLSFHITEVGHVVKKFIDCGGKVHTVETCQLQAWVGPDVDHRIEASKMAKILELASEILPHEFLDVEIEYEGATISQFPVADAQIEDDAVILQLGTKHTDCLAKELCLVPANGCEPGGGCC